MMRLGRNALPVFAVAYGVWEALVGIASGILVQEGEAAGGAGHRALADAVERITTHPAVGDLGVFNSVGSIAWLVAISAAIVALHRAGAGRAGLVLLAIATFIVMHAPPIGPAALLCLSAAGWLLERRRSVHAQKRVGTSPWLRAPSGTARSPSGS